LNTYPTHTLFCRMLECKLCFIWNKCADIIGNSFIDKMQALQLEVYCHLSSTEIQFNFYCYVIFATCQSGQNPDRVIGIRLLVSYLLSLLRISYFDPSPGLLLLPDNHHKWHTLLLTVLELGQHLRVVFVENLCLWYVRVGEGGR